MPGIGKLRTKDDIPEPEDLDIRSCVILERTPKPKLGRRLDAGERSFRIHVTGRGSKPPLKTGQEPGRACGIDHGIVLAMTAADGDGTVETFQNDLDDARGADRRLRRLSRRISSCAAGSRRGRRREEQKHRIRRKQDRRRRHRRRSWANHLVHRNDTVLGRATVGW